jgi:hypothetical protein
MISQECATAQLNKDQLAPAIGEEDLDLAVWAIADFVREEQRNAHDRAILLRQSLSLPCCGLYVI